MNLVLLSHPPTPPHGPSGPSDPAARAMARQFLVEAKGAVERAVVSTTATDRINPALPFWSHRAVEKNGYAAAMLQAVEGLKLLTHVPIPMVVYTDTIEAARRLIVDAVSRAQPGVGPDPLAFASANAKLKSLLHQFDFDIAKHDPEAPKPTPKWN
jgi:hypothetical protein